MALYKHGGRGTRLYNLWKDMRRRCYSSKRSDYHLYGGRGIRICDEWSEFSVFKEWAYSHGYVEGLSIERTDFNGNYEPSNCRWIPLSEQAKNTRQNVFETINGETKIIADWARQFNLPYGTVIDRYRRGKRGQDLIVPKQITMKGKHHTEETKKRIAEKMKGNTHAAKHKGGDALAYDNRFI